MTASSSPPPHPPAPCLPFPHPPHSPNGPVHARLRAGAASPSFFFSPLNFCSVPAPRGVHHPLRAANGRRSRMPLTACPLSSHGWGGTGAPHPSPVHRVPTLPLPPMVPHAGVDKIAKQKSKRYSFSNGRGWGSTVAGHADGPTPHRFPQPLPQPSRPPAHAPRARPVPPAPTVPAGSSLPPPPAGGGPRAAVNATHGACRPPLPARGGVGSPPVARAPSPTPVTVAGRPPRGRHSRLLPPPGWSWAWTPARGRRR